MVFHKDSIMFSSDIKCAKELILLHPGSVTRNIQDTSQEISKILIIAKENKTER